MKRVLVLCFVLILVVACLAFPVLAADLAGGYFIVADSVLGRNMKFYFSSDFSAGSLTYDDQGYLFNLSNTNVYLYCPAYPETSMFAQRFSRFKYQTSTSGYVNTMEDLQLRNVTDTNVLILDSAPRMRLPDTDLLTLIFSVLLIGVGAFVILRR